MNSVKLVRILALTMLAAIGAHHYIVVHAPPDMQRYFDRVRTAGALVPGHIAGWVGQDVPVPVQAAATLRPDLMISRRYVNVETGMSAGLLFVHCADAHHMVGHFPLRCYPARGWVLRSSSSRDWTVGNMKVQGTEYEFSRDTIGALGWSQSIVVANCLLRPGGQILRDMDGLSKSIVGAGGSSSGAGQLQVYFDAKIPQEQRALVVSTLIGGYRPVIDAILKDPAQ